MNLGDLIRQYRQTHDLSQRQFAEKCDLSNGYISILEKGANPNTGKPVTPTIPQFQKLAAGMNMSVMEMLEQIDDMPIDISAIIDTPTQLKTAPSTEYNLIQIAARDGSYKEKRLTDEDLAAVLVLIDRLPDAAEDL